TPATTSLCTDRRRWWAEQAQWRRFTPGCSPRSEPSSALSRPYSGKIRRRSTTSPWEATDSTARLWGPTHAAVSVRQSEPESLRSLPHWRELLAGGLDCRNQRYDRRNCV